MVDDKSGFGILESLTAVNGSSRAPLGRLMFTNGGGLALLFCWFTINSQETWYYNDIIINGVPLGTHYNPCNLLGALIITRYPCFFWGYIRHKFDTFMVTDPLKGTQQAHDIVLTLQQRCLNINNIVSTLKQRRLFVGYCLGITLFFELTLLKLTKSLSQRDPHKRVKFWGKYFLSKDLSSLNIY